MDNGASDTDNDDVPTTPEVDFREIMDFDMDGVSDVVDLDDDNDGIPDTDEAPGLPAPSLDDDGDGIPNYVDTDNGPDTDGNGIVDVYDTDGDGVPNHLDLDADNDGIYDIVETGNGDEDTDGDGQTNNPVGANGLDDTIESDDTPGATVPAAPNTDGTGNPNFLDIDSDDDGIPDNVEGQTTADYIAPIADDPATPGVNEADTDGDGINDAYDTDFAGAVGIDPVDTFDTAGDGLLDYLDEDSDDDLSLIHI